MLSPCCAEHPACAAGLLFLQERLGQIEREASKQHGFLASVEKLAAAVDPTKRAPSTSGISRWVEGCVAKVPALKGRLGHQC